MQAVKRALLIVCIFFVSAALLSGCQENQTNSGSILGSELQTTKTANYKTTVAVYGDLIKTSSLSLEPRYFVTDTLKYESEYEVYFDGFHVSNGQQFSKGDILASFTKIRSEAELERCRLAYERALESFKKGSAELLEAAEGYGLTETQKALKMLDYEQYVLSGSVELEKLRAEYEAAERAGEPEYLLAPYDGIVYSTSVISEGTLIAPDKELMTIKKADTLIMVGKSATTNFLYNMTVTVEYGRSDNRKTVTGRVVATDQVMPEGSPKTEQIYVKLDELIPESELVKASMTVRTVQAKDALLVPRAAVTIEEGRYFVSVLSGDMVQKRYVIRGIVGGTVGEQSAVILSGLEAGQTVILD